MGVVAGAGPHGVQLVAAGRQIGDEGVGRAGRVRPVDAIGGAVELAAGKGGPVGSVTPGAVERA